MYNVEKRNNMDIKKLNEKLEKANQIWEMANLPKKRTGLPVIIYISGNKSSHGPRIKFFDSYADSIGSNYDLLMDLYDGKIDEIDAGMQQQRI